MDAEPRFEAGKIGKIGNERTIDKDKAAGIHIAKCFSGVGGT